MTRASFRTLFYLLSLSALAEAQDEAGDNMADSALVAPDAEPSGESAWNPAWDPGSLAVGSAPLGLTLSAGRRAVVQRSLESGDERRVASDTYVLAQLSLPFARLFGQRRRPLVRAELPEPRSARHGREVSGQQNAAPAGRVRGSASSQAGPAPSQAGSAPSQAGSVVTRQALASAQAKVEPALGSLGRSAAAGLFASSKLSAQEAEESSPPLAIAPEAERRWSESGGPASANSPTDAFEGRASVAQRSREGREDSLAPLPTEFVQQVLLRALAASGLSQSGARLDSLARRSRSSGLLPEVRLRGATGLDQARSIDAGALLTSDGVQRSATDSLLELRLTFHLERLLLGDEEPGVERLRVQLQRERSDLVDQVLEMLLDWDDARRQVLRPELHEDERASAAAVARRLAVRLDVATDSWFRGGVALTGFSE